MFDLFEFRVFRLFFALLLSIQPITDNFFIDFRTIPDVYGNEEENEDIDKSSLKSKYRDGYLSKLVFVQVL
jgi:hypothetical protein